MLAEAPMEDEVDIEVGGWEKERRVEAKKKKRKIQRINSGFEPQTSPK